MNYRTISWKWTLNDDCTADGGTIQVNSRSWTDDEVPRICFQMVGTDPCEGWSSVTFKEVDPGGIPLFEQEGTAYVKRGKTCACHTQLDADSERINRLEESKMIKIEAFVQVPNGENKWSYGFIDYIGTG